MESLPLSADDHELHQLQECLLIGYKLDADAGAFTLTCEHWEKPVPGQRAFLKLIFRGVRRFEREPGLNPALQQYDTEYRLRGAPGSTVFQAVELGSETAGRRANFWFGPAYGGCSFSYEDVRAFIRHTRSEEKRGEWEYRDLQSNTPIDFFEPFGRD